MIFSYDIYVYHPNVDYIWMTMASWIGEIWRSWSWKLAGKLVYKSMILYILIYMALYPDANHGAGITYKTGWFWTRANVGKYSSRMALSPAYSGPEPRSSQTSPVDCDNGPLRCTVPISCWFSVYSASCLVDKTHETWVNTMVNQLYIYIYIYTVLYIYQDI